MLDAIDGNNPRLPRMSSIGVARRVVKFGSLERGAFIERMNVLEYISESEYYHLESSAQRISRLKKDSNQFLSEFLEYFFDNTVFGLKTGCDWGWSIKNRW